MKALKFLMFACATVFGGIGVEENNFPAMLAGLVFVILSLLLIMKDCENEIKKGK